MGPRASRPHFSDQFVTNIEDLFATEPYGLTSVPLVFHIILCDFYRENRIRPPPNMSYEEFLRQLGKAGLSIREFAALLRMNSNSISNYCASGEVPDHLAVVAALMGEMSEHRLDFRAVLSRIQLRTKKLRGSTGPGRFGGGSQLDLGLLP